MTPLTRILQDAQRGDPAAQRQLASSLYEELRGMARREMAGEARHHTLQATALVHEAWMRLVQSEGTTFENRAHFFGAAATALRRVLVDHARRRSSGKRGGDRLQVSLEAADSIESATPLDDAELLELDEALSELAEFAPTRASVVELRFFAGMTEEEVARSLQISPSSVTRSWRAARAWLRGRLSRDGR